MLYLCNEFEKFGALAVLNKNMTLQRNSKVRKLLKVLIILNVPLLE